MEDEFSPKARMALSALRDERPSDESRARVRERVLGASVAAGAGTLIASGAKATTGMKTAAGVTAKVASAGAGASAAGGTLASLSGVKLALVLAGLGTIGAGTGVTMMARSGAPQAQFARAMQVATPRATGEFVRAATSTNPAAPIVEELREPEPTSTTMTAIEPERTLAKEPRVPPARRKRAVKTETLARGLPAQENALPAQENTLRAESALLLQALTLHQAGKACQALALLDAHTRKFGAHADLAPERERMRKRFIEAGAATPSLACHDQKGPLP